MAKEIISRYHLGNNFWDVCPELKVLEGFNKFTSSNKRSSDIMWAIAFCLRRESPMYNLPDKWELAATDIIKDKKFDWEKHEGIVSLFKATQLTQAERSLIAWEELMFKRDKYLKQQDYYFDCYLTDKNGDNVLSKTGQFITVKGTADQLDKAFGTTPKMYNDFFKIKEEMEKEDHMRKGKGNKNLSDSETGEI